ncbi:hypothetical protein BS50DRAFT_550716 [Corynespora cassiicola Philippines]|uniref:Distal membrane-arm assembly complex protein 1-like domain-containing protein n=1 Tax=Corynespora cassiicola Philippines TaxID=1448308 RepID=A0A2T2NQN9_CORCC|nr:hypothetical protein BS50DRAFT_550716 [Corynespora cassiicola Philippines]
MAKDEITTPTFKEALKRDRAKYDDCTPCRVVGAGVFLGAGTYTYFTGHAQLREKEAEILKSGSRFGMASRRAGITGLAAAMVGLGVYRWIA